MPGSDAKEGPLSDITASGQALMTTFEKGIDSSSARPAEAFAARLPNVGAAGGAAASESKVVSNTPQPTVITIGTINESSAGNVADAIDAALRKSITLNPW